MRWPVLLGTAALLLAAAGAALEWHQFLGGWLAAVVLLAAWPLGSMALLLTHALTGGRWGEAIRPALRLGVCALPLLLPALLPVAAGLHALYPWASADGVNGWYLNGPFQLARLLAYAAVWGVLAWCCLRGRGLARVAPAGLFLLALTVSFAAVDSTLALDRHAVSSIYGMLAAAEAGLLALAAAVLLSARAATPGQRGDLGKLLLALVALWMYLDFMQLLIVRQSGLAAEMGWYLTHTTGGWGAVRAAIVAGQFVLPAALLLAPSWQRSPAVLVGAALAVLASAVLRAWWTVLPPLGQAVGWVALASMAGLCLLAICFARWAAARLAGAAAHG